MATGKVPTSDQDDNTVWVDFGWPASEERLVSAIDVPTTPLEPAGGNVLLW
ncbi:hypothetical protein [Mycobacterium sp.]|jgi:hypothetical protein|uniref:hypothetical protein n=1 Tax=Mycobacterium sp. TaxID=1785 RepID=UPI002D30C857|nr:hypothetical protein [Mycobacterium sp.]HZA09949.1 hypothetical protein [Mycobacterium sp.]